ncbi:MAG: carboxypeptidase-like regulatory domain-containing protein [Planctomycetota bacterium]
MAGIEVWAEVWQSDRRIAATDGDGLYKIGGLPLNQPIGVRVGFGKVPEGMRSAATYRSGEEGWRAFHELWPTGFYDAVTQIENATKAKELNVQFLPEAIVRGRLVRAVDLSPIVGGQVQLHPWRTTGTHSPGATVTTNPLGEFEAKVCPGRYKVYFYPAYSGVEEDLYISRVPPVSVEVLGGEIRDLGELEFGGGKSTLVGRVMDQYGAPVSNLAVLAYVGDPVEKGEPPNDMGAVLGMTTTDGAGIYTVSGLYKGAVTIQAGFQDYESSAEITGKRLATWAAPVSVVLDGSANQVKVPDVIATLSEPFFIELTIENATQGGGVEGAEVYLRALDGEIGASGLPRVIQCRGKTELIHWACQTPAGSIELRVKDKKGVWVHSEIIAPIAHGHFKSTLYVR